MERQDLRRGELPEIRADEDTITFVLTIRVPVGSSCQLVLRCERNGEIYASLRAKA
jgi:hypothetical protein